MALIKCSECKRDVSSNAKNCPNCDTPIAQPTKCPKCGNKNTKVMSSEHERVLGLSFYK